MNREDYQDVLERMEQATGNEIFCDVICRFPYELNEEQLTEVCERCPLNNTLDKISEEIDDLKNFSYPFLDILLDDVQKIIDKYKAESEDKE